MGRSRRSPAREVAERPSSSLLEDLGPAGVALWLTALAISFGLAAAPLAAGTCNVPASHPTIQQAVLDITCTTIEIAAGTYDESIDIARPLTLNGPGGGGAVIEGLATVRGAGAQVSLNNLAVENGCSPDGLRTDAGAELSGTNLSVTSNSSLPCPSIPFIFIDGFESSDASAWSSTAP